MLALPPLQPTATLWAIELGENDEGALRVVVIEAMPNGPPQITDQGPPIVAVQVSPTATSRSFEFRWQSYVSYLVENESFAMPTRGELVGPGLHVVSSSPLLDFVATHSIAPQVLGPLRHWCLVCDDHVVHVVGVEEPTIRQLG